MTTQTDAQMQKTIDEQAAKIAALEAALRKMLHTFDKQLPEGTIGRRVCDQAREALSK